MPSFSLYPQSYLTFILCHPLLFITHHLSLLCHIIPLLYSLWPLICNAIPSSLFSFTPPPYPISACLLYTLSISFIPCHLSSLFTIIPCHPLSHAIYSSLSIVTPSPYTMLSLPLYCLSLSPLKPCHPLFFIPCHPVIQCHPHCFVPHPQSLPYTIPSLLNLLSSFNLCRLLLILHHPSPLPQIIPSSSSSIISPIYFIYLLYTP